MALWTNRANRSLLLRYLQPPRRSGRSPLRIRTPRSWVQCLCLGAYPRVLVIGSGGGNALHPIPGCGRDWPHGRGGAGGCFWIVPLLSSCLPPASIFNLGGRYWRSFGFGLWTGHLEPWKEKTEPKGITEATGSVHAIHFLRVGVALPAWVVYLW